MKLFRFTGKIIKAIYHDPRDILVFGGVSLVGYGLYQYMPWLSFVTTGALLIYIGLFAFAGIRKGMTDGDNQ